MRPQWAAADNAVALPVARDLSDHRGGGRDGGALESEPGITVNAIALRLKSRGAVRIRSDRPDELPEIDARWWSDPDDMAFMIQMAKLVRTFMRQPALRPFVGDEVIPGEAVESDEDLAKSLEWLTSPGIHATGTCRMGEPGNSVVNSRLRVHGISNLRVVDCSVMPAPPAGNTNGPAMAIGWRAAELIREDHSS